VVQAIQDAALIVICPSNPWVSIDPILAVPSLKSEIESRPVVAVSPIIGGKAVKGPVVKMYRELGIQPSALAVANHYRGLLDGFVFDEIDRELESDIQHLNVRTMMMDTLMSSSSQRKCIGQEVLNFGKLFVEKQ
jgi:LPPG:FO 2-phospho-L-lactate transferase